MSTAKEWFPHEMVPWSRGRDYDADEVWDPDTMKLCDGARSALFLNILTEDNLPHYYRADQRQVRQRRRRGASGTAAGPPKRAGTRS